MFFQQKNYKNFKNILFGKKDHEIDQILKEFQLHFNMQKMMNNQLKIFFGNLNVKLIIHASIMEFKRDFIYI